MSLTTSERVYFPNTLKEKKTNIFVPLSGHLEPNPTTDLNSLTLELIRKMEGVLSVLNILLQGLLVRKGPWNWGGLGAEGAAAAAATAGEAGGAAPALPGCSDRDVLGGLSFCPAAAAGSGTGSGTCPWGGTSGSGSRPGRALPWTRCEHTALLLLRSGFPRELNAWLPFLAACMQIRVR